MFSPVISWCSHRLILCCFPSDWLCNLFVRVWVNNNQPTTLLKHLQALSSPLAFNSSCLLESSWSTKGKRKTKNRDHNFKLAGLKNWAWALTQSCHVKRLIKSAAGLETGNQQATGATWCENYRVITSVFATKLKTNLSKEETFTRKMRLDMMERNPPCAGST